MSSAAPAFSDFASRVQPFEDLWTSFEVRYSSVRQPGGWRNLFTRAQFGWETVPADKHESVVDTGALRAGRLLFPAARGHEWLGRLESGAVTVDGVEVTLGHDVVRSGPGDPGTFVRYAWKSWRHDRFGGLRDFLDADPEWEQGFELTGCGERAATLVDPRMWGEIHDALLSADLPYRGIGEFSTSYLGFRDPKTPSQPVGVEVVASFGTVFSEWALEGDRFTGMILRPPTSQDAEVEVAAILDKASKVTRLHLPVHGAEPVQGLPLVQSEVTFPFEGFRSVDLHLLLRGHDVDALQVSFPSPDTPNPRLEVLSGLDQVGLRLTETLQKPQTVHSPQAFELVVSWLLHLCGFQVMLTDLPPLKGGEVTDMVAFDPFSDQGLVVEVSGSDGVNRDALARLVRRTATAQGAAPDSKLHAVLVLPATDTLRAEEITLAGESGVALLSGGDLRTLLTMASQNPVATDLLQNIILKPAAERNP